MTHFLLLTLMLAQSGVEGTIDYETARLQRRIQAVKVAERITIDGRLDDAGWANAPMATGFIQTEPREGEASSERTRCAFYMTVKTFISDCTRTIRA
jgi:hypothetical protein